MSFYLHVFDYWEADDFLMFINSMFFFCTVPYIHFKT